MSAKVNYDALSIEELKELIREEAHQKGLVLDQVADLNAKVYAHDATIRAIGRVLDARADQAERDDRLRADQRESAKSPEFRR